MVKARTVEATHSLKLRKGKYVLQNYIMKNRYGDTILGWIYIGATSLQKRKLSLIFVATQYRHTTWKSKH